LFQKSNDTPYDLLLDNMSRITIIFVTECLIYGIGIHFVLMCLIKKN